MANLIGVNSAFLADLDYNNLTPGLQAQVAALITASSQLIERYCNRVFEAADREERLNGNGYDFIFISRPPINQLFSIFFTDQIDGEEFEIDDSEFFYEYKIGKIYWKPYSDSESKFRGVFPEAKQNILVSYNGGYSTIPEPVQLACAQMVLGLYSPSMSTANIEKEKLGEYFYQIHKASFENQLAEHKKILAMYKLYKCL